MSGGGLLANLLAGVAVALFRALISFTRDVTKKVRQQRNSVVHQRRDLEDGHILLAIFVIVAIALRSQAPDAPPRAAKFMLLLIPKKYRENIVGDLEEEYRTQVLPEFGPRKAAIWYWTQVLCSLLPLAWSQIKRIAGLAAVWNLIRR